MASDQDTGLPDCGDAIDSTVFEQILEMDDDDTREFSQGIVFGFFEQAQETFKSLKQAIEEKDMETLSSQGHFLKGSSATLGLTKVKDSCEKMQHLGAGKDETGEKDVDEATAIARIKQIFETLQTDFEDAEKRLRKFYQS